MPRTILTKFRMKHHLVHSLGHSRTKFELNNSKLAQVRQFTAHFQQIQNLKKECFDRFWLNSIPKIVDRCIIFVCSFRTISQIV